MSKTELYLKYRPQKFSEVHGNNGTVQALTSMLKQGTLPHVLLFHGPSGCGKTTMARIVAKALKCGDFDLSEMNCSSNRGVDDIRRLINMMNLAPTGGPVRVFLLDESHQLTNEAQNAALKMLEDTPEHVYFLLCTTEPKKLKKTIRTRCSDMPVELLDYGCMKKLVEDVSRKEQITTDEDVIDALCDFAEGSPRMALVGLDKIRHIEDPQEQINTLKRAEAESETRELCQALLKRKSWSTVANILKGLNVEPESIRWAVLGYMKAVLLNGENLQAFRVIEAFEEPFYESKMAGVVRACYESVALR